MPAFMLTIHAYRSWTEDNPKGYIQRTEQGVRPPDPQRAKARSYLASQPPHRFTTQQKQLILDELPGFMARRKLRLHGCSCTPTHLHVITSWFGSEPFFKTTNDPMPQAQHLAAKLKNILALELSKADGSRGRKWFSRGCDYTPIEDHDHLNHLLEVYLPKHQFENGIVRIYNQKTI